MTRARIISYREGHVFMGGCLCARPHPHPPPKTGFVRALNDYALRFIDRRMVLRKAKAAEKPEVSE